MLDSKWLALVQCDDKTYRLTHASLNCHPDAVENLFGFLSYKELVYTLNSLFDDIPQR
jgi:hypothetical protein